MLAMAVGGKVLNSEAEMTVLLLLWACAFVPWGLKLISSQSMVTIAFLFLIPLTVLKAFADYRRKRPF